jgi:hypothetical protein
MESEPTRHFGSRWPFPQPAECDLINTRITFSRLLQSFVDAHVDFTKIYWDGEPGSPPCNYEPPAIYNYNWNGD